MNTPDQRLCPIVSIIAPTFNELENIEKLYEKLSLALSETPWELIIVDDNSPDGTWNKAMDFALSVNNLKVMRRVRSRGLSSACIEGAQLAQGRYCVVMDADLQHDETIIPAMLKKLDQGADLVIGSRFFGDGSAAGLSSKKRLLVSKIGNFVSRMLLKHALTDSLTGFFALPTETFMRLSPRLSDSGFKILVDLLFVGSFKQVEEIGFKFRSRQFGESKLDHVIIWQFMVFLLEKLSFGMIPARLFSFAFVGTSGLLVHFVVLFIFLDSDFEFWQAQLSATLVALTSNFFINNWLTFYDKRLSGSNMLTGLFLFTIFASVGIAANVGISTYLLDNFQGQFMGSNALIYGAAFAGILIDTLWKFVMSERFVWKQKN